MSVRDQLCRAFAQDRTAGPRPPASGRSPSGRSRGTGRWLAAVSGFAALVLGSGTAVAAPAVPTYEHYVALGDSYTSGPLIPLPRLDPLGCFRSTNNYPAWLADRLDVSSYTDVSCGGADSTNFTSGQGVFLGYNPPQLDALSAQTDLVTVGMGGNDFGVFGDLVGVCPDLRETDPTGAPCREHFTTDGVDQIKQRISKTEDRLQAAYQEIQRRSPQARVVAVGYPRIAPETGVCPDILPFADGDYRWLSSVEKSLNDAVATAAAQTDVTYVDTFTPSAGHSACATGGAAWIQGKTTNIFKALSYHPNKKAMVAEAALIEGALSGTHVDAAELASQAGNDQPQHSESDQLPVGAPGQAADRAGSTG